MTEDEELRGSGQRYKLRDRPQITGIRGRMRRSEATLAGSRFFLLLEILPSDLVLSYLQVQYRAPLGVPLS